MFLDPRSIIKKAYEEKYAIGHFNVFNLESALAVIRAAEEKKAPIFMAVSETSIEYAGFENIFVIMKTVVKNSKTPVIIHLDHGKSKNYLDLAIKASFNSIMFDGSKYMLEKNILNTKNWANSAHQFGLICEGEIGAIDNVNKKDKKANFTDPVDAKQFALETGVDMLAISIGNKHGLPKDEPDKIDFKRLEIINENLNIPLVLHGASSMPSNTIKKLISNGICKINIDNDLKASFKKGLEQYLYNHPCEIDSRKILGFGSLKIQKTVESKIEMFGSARKI